MLIKVQEDLKPQNYSVFIGFEFESTEERHVFFVLHKFKIPKSFFLFFKKTFERLGGKINIKTRQLERHLRLIYYISGKGP